jgi:hypothetical protein
MDAKTKAEIRLLWPELWFFAELQKPKPTALDERRRAKQPVSNGKAA